MKKNPDTRGFTLVEVLAALAVIAIALVAVMKSFGQSIDTTIALRERTLALWVAQNHLTNHYATRDWPPVGTTEGTDDMAGRSWHWSEKVIGLGDNPNMRRLEIEVRAAPGQQAVARLIGALRKPAP